MEIFVADRSTSRCCRMARVLIVTLTSVCGSTVVPASDNPSNTRAASEVFISDQAAALGMSPERLARIQPSYEAGVRDGEIPGAVVLIARNDAVVYSASVGFRDLAAQVPMTRDTRFYLASMTKPIVSVAAMMLVEDGVLQLPLPVSHYLPELKHLKVGREIVDAKTGRRTLQLEPPRREPTVHDLLRHTSGFTYGPFGDSPVQRAYQAANLVDFGQSNAELVTKLASLPLAYQPGETFEYSMSTDVLGRVIEVVSGMPLEKFIEQRITAPLGMLDTSFGATDPQRLARARTLHAALPTGTPRWASGGGGLIGTAEDYLKFATLLLNGGELNGKRLLSRKTVELMTSNHLPPDVTFGPYDLGVMAPSPEQGQGFGLGFAVRLDAGRSPLPGSVGDYSWAGASGTYFWIDPRERLIAIVMTAAPEVRAAYRYRARTLVYQSIERSR